MQLDITLCIALSTLTMIQSFHSIPFMHIFLIEIMEKWKFYNIIYVYNVRDFLYGRKISSNSTLTTMKPFSTCATPDNYHQGDAGRNRTYISVVWLPIRVSLHQAFNVLNMFIDSSLPNTPLSLKNIMIVLSHNSRQNLKHCSLNVNDVVHMRNSSNQ